MALMTIEERNDLVDLVAQAVIDKIEERDRINGLANMVVQRVLELQHQEAALKEAEDGKKPRSKSSKSASEKEKAHGKAK